MSFILDALKKADAERHLGELPGLHTAPVAAESVAAVARRGWVRPAAGAGIIALVIAGVVLLRPWSQGERVAALPVDTPATNVAVVAPVALAAPAAPVAQAAPAAPAAPVAPAAPAAPANPSTAVGSTPPVAANEVPSPPPKPVTQRPPLVQRPAVVASAADTATAAKPAKTESAATAQDPGKIVGEGIAVAATGSTKSRNNAASMKNSPSSPTHPPGQTATAEPVSTLTLSQLPPAIRSELPAMAVGGSMYSSNPADRMLLVDKRMLHEGDEIAPGLLLESIQPKGAILRYKGYQFRLPL